MSQKSILVTGAAGYVGAHLIKALASSYSFNVDATDFNFNQNDIKKYVSNIIVWDITKERIEKFNNYDVVVHLAARTMVEMSTKMPDEYYLTNIYGTHNLLNNVKDYGHMLYCSTGSAVNPSTSPYALSKRAAEDIVIQRSPNYSICRFYNVSGNAGFKKFDETYYHLIRKAAAVAVGRFDSIEIFGTSYDTPDGTAIRNYTHVLDIVDSIVRIIDYGPSMAIENLGNASGYSVREVINTMKQVSGANFTVNEALARIGDPAKAVLCDQSRFFEERFSLQDQCMSSLIFEQSILNTTR